LGRKKLGPIDRVTLHAERDKKITDYVNARAVAGRRGDRARAVTAAAEYFHTDTRTIERALRRQRRIEQLPRFPLIPKVEFNRLASNAQVAAPMLRKLTFLRQWITLAELEQRGDLTEEWAMEIARLREQLAQREPRRRTLKTATKSTTRKR
jgi:hypothetical protein